jgi:hypothetical protein
MWYENAYPWIQGRCKVETYRETDPTSPVILNAVKNH